MKSVVLELCVEVPSTHRPMRARASARIAAVIPDPHVTPSRHVPASGSPEARKTCSSLSGGRRRPPS